MVDGPSTSRQDPGPQLERVASTPPDDVGSFPLQDDPHPPPGHSHPALDGFVPRSESGESMQRDDSVVSSPDMTITLTQDVSPLVDAPSQASDRGRGVENLTQSTGLDEEMPMDPQTVEDPSAPYEDAPFADDTRKTPISAYDSSSMKNADISLDDHRSFTTQERLRVADNEHDTEQSGELLNEESQDTPLKGGADVQEVEEHGDSGLPVAPVIDENKQPASSSGEKSVLPHQILFIS